MPPESHPAAPEPPAAQPGTAAPAPGIVQATVAELVEHQAVDGIFAVARAERLLTRTGQPYLTLQLRRSHRLDRRQRLPRRRRHARALPDG